MTENQLRQKVADTINAWVGATKGSAKHLDILEVYNNYRPLARGYKVQVKDAYCATTVSAAYIRAGIAKYTGTECGVEKYTIVAKKLGIWVENDAHTPKIGDACVYDWQDNGAGDCTGAGDHIGIVTKVSTGSFVVTEGNMSGGVVGRRNLQVNGRYIRGFICPNYASKATEKAPEKSIDEIATEVLAGRWGNNPERKQRLEAAGYNYEAVQAAVNQKAKSGASAKKSVSAVAQEVLAGKWVNNPARKKALEAVGYDYSAVQAEVNRLCRK